MEFMEDPCLGCQCLLPTPEPKEELPPTPKIVDTHVRTDVIYCFLG